VCSSDLHIDHEQGVQATEDARWMAEALAAARGVDGRTWPNPPVGAVVVRDGVMVGRGAHQGAGSLHAEPVALADAGELASGATIYVTLEPCNHQGRTGPCAPALVAAGIKRVVIAMLDPNPTVAGGGVAHLLAAGLTVECGVAAPEALELVWPFVSTENFGRSFVELKTAHSLDGFFAPLAKHRSEQAPVYLTGKEARRDVHRRRRRVDLVLVGEGTVAADRPRLDARLASGDVDLPQVDPMPAYVDTDLSWRGGFQRVSYLVFAGEKAGVDARQAIEADGGEVIVCRESQGKVDPTDLVRQAYKHGFNSLMIEGGPTLAGAFLCAGVVDRWVKYQAPIVLGDGITWPAEFLGHDCARRDFYLTQSERLGVDLVSVYDRQCFADMLKRVAGGGI